MIKTAIFVGILILIIAVYFGRQKTLTKRPSDLNPQYDYIIVGGGSAGSVLAARLSEQASISVLLLEAGGEESEIFYSHIPGAVPFLQDTDFDWGYLTVPQKHCCNGLVENKSESIQIDRFRTSQYHGTDGPLSVSWSAETKLGSLYLDALREIGQNVYDDLNGPDYEGFTRVQATIKNGKRASTATAYLRPAMNRPNLHVVIKAHVTKIAFNYNDEEKRAVGVEYTHEGYRHRVLSNREIVLSAGSINSPHLLMLSGIGQRSELQRYGIGLVHELTAVGKNLRDHILAHTLLTFNETIGLNADEIVSPIGLVKATVEYFLFGTGPLSNSGMELTGFIRTGLSNDTRPDAQLYMFPMNPLYEDLYKLVNLKPEVNEAMQAPVRGKSSVAFIGSVLLHPRNSGELRLQSADPFVPPIIDPRYFESDVDVEIMLRGLKLMLDAALNTQVFKRYNASLAEVAMPGCQDRTLYSDDYWRCVIRNRAFTLYHPVSTCRMGSSPMDSVVDSELRVHGVKGLRIVDASVFPDQISGNPNAPTIMLAEKAADLIKATPFLP